MYFSWENLRGGHRKRNTVLFLRELHLAGQICYLLRYLSRFHSTLYLQQKLHTGFSMKEETIWLNFIRP